MALAVTAQSHAVTGATDPRAPNTVNLRDESATLELSPKQNRPVLKPVTLHQEPAREKPAPASEVLARVAHVAATGAGTGELLNEIATGTGDALAVDMVLVRALAPDGDKFVIQAAAGPAHLTGRDLLGGETPVPAAFRDISPGATFTIDLDNTHDLALLGPNERRAFRDLNVSQLLIIPLFTNGQLVGRIDLARSGAEPFDDEAVSNASVFAAFAAGALNSRRLRSISEESQVYRTVFGLFHDMEQLSDPRTILQSAVELVVREPGCQRAYAMLWDEGRREFVPIAVTGLDARLVEMLKMISLSPQVVPAFDRAMHSSQPLVIEDARTSTLLPRSLVDALGMRSAMVVPLRGRRRLTLGFLLLDYADRLGQFDEHDVEMMESIATHLAAMVENAMLYAEISASSDSLAVINEIGIQLAMLTDEDGLFRQLHHHIGAVIDATYFALGLLSEDRQEIHLRTAADGEYYDSSMLYVPGRDAICRAIQLGRGSIFGTRDGNDPDQWAMNIEGLERCHSQMTAPITIGRDVIGAMTVQSPFRHAYSPRDMSLFNAIAVHVGVALENARLYRIVQERGDRRAAVLDQVIRRQETERKELVEDIHDNTLQTLAACLYSLDRADDVMRQHEASDEVITQIEQVRLSLSENIDRLRKRIFELRPATLDILGLEPALRDLLASLEEKRGFQVQLEFRAPRRLRAGLDTLVYRLIQEALSLIIVPGVTGGLSVRVRTNVDTIVITVHAMPTSVEIELDDAPPYDLHGDIGMMALVERTELAGGSIRLARTIGGGSSLQITLPYASSDQATDARSPGVQIGTSRDGGSWQPR